MKKIVLATLVLVFLLAGCSKISPGREIELSQQKGAFVPDGYELLDASITDGDSPADFTVFFIREKNSGKIYEYGDGKIGAEIIIPKGFVLVAVSSFGLCGDYRTYYCREEITGLIYEFVPK